MYTAMAKLPNVLKHNAMTMYTT